MRFSIQLCIIDDDGHEIADDHVISLDKTDGRLEDIGLSLDEGKDLLARLQTRVVLPKPQASPHAGGPASIVTAPYVVRDPTP